VKSLRGLLLLDIVIVVSICALACKRNSLEKGLAHGPDEDQRLLGAEQRTVLAGVITSWPEGLLSIDVYKEDEGSYDISVYPISFLIDETVIEIAQEIEKMNIHSVLLRDGVFVMTQGSTGNVSGGRSWGFIYSPEGTAPDHQIRLRTRDTLEVERITGEWYTFTWISE
jgi:hypothetical protein